MMEEIEMGMTWLSLDRDASVGSISAESSGSDRLEAAGFSNGAGDSGALCSIKSGRTGAKDSAAT
jgi:hypothetical protein